MNIKLTLGERLKDLRVERNQAGNAGRADGSVQIGTVEMRATT